MYFQTKLKLITVVCFAFIAGALIVPSASMQTKVETAGQKFKNIKVLNDMPADQLGKVMNIAAASLGVDCDFCHVPDQWAKDDKKEKSTAREMMKMTFALNKEHFDGRTEISCNTCHNGREHPQALPNLNPVAADERPKQPAVKPTVDQIVDRYLMALGGKEKLAKITSRAIKANRVEPDGKTSEPEILDFKAHKYFLSTTYGKHVVSEGFDGSLAWKLIGGEVITLKADESDQIRREADLFMPTDLKAIYTKMDFRLLDRIDGREVYIVTAVTSGGVRERLAFDVGTGLLVRRIAATPTILGNFVYQVDYADYKQFAGVKIATTIHYAMPNIRWTRKVLQVKNNARVDDAVFRTKR